VTSPISPTAQSPKPPCTSPPERRLRRADVPHGTLDLARSLIGTVLVRRFADGTCAGGRIVETEAYAPGDPSSHAFRGPTKRNRAMFGPPLFSYVYFIYGTAWCLNVTSEPEATGAAVLIRAIEPAYGRAAMQARRGPAIAERDLVRGPGRLCAALGIDGSFDGLDLESAPDLWLAPAPPGSDAFAVATSPRIGLSRAIEFEHRFFVPGSRWVSGSSRLPK
jgi:DNA-3-methyladenine glycosylase